MIILTRKGIIFIVIGIELILQAAISNCIVFNNQYLNALEGQVLAIFCVVISVCEIVLFLALSLRIHQEYRTTDLAKLNADK
jgi:NADH-quinone oxidoreductase subunit K